MHFERQNAFQDAKIIFSSDFFFKKNMSPQPNLPKIFRNTLFFYIWSNLKSTPEFGVVSFQLLDNFDISGI